MRRRRPYSVSPIASYADPQCASSRRGRSRTGVAAVLMGLLLEQFRTREAADRSARLAEPASLKATLAGIGQKIESGGGQTLSAVESKIWNQIGRASCRERVCQYV